MYFLVLLYLKYVCMCSISRISPSWARAGCKKTLCLLHYPCKKKFIHSFILSPPLSYTHTHTNAHACINTCWVSSHKWPVAAFWAKFSSMLRAAQDSCTLPSYTFHKSCALPSYTFHKTAVHSQVTHFTRAVLSQVTHFIRQLDTPKLHISQDSCTLPSYTFHKTAVLSQVKQFTRQLYSLMLYNSIFWWRLRLLFWQLYVHSGQEFSQLVQSTGIITKRIARQVQFFQLFARLERLNIVHCWDDWLWSRISLSTQSFKSDGVKQETWISWKQQQKRGKKDKQNDDNQNQ